MAIVDSPDDAAEVMPFDQQAAGTANSHSIPTAAEKNHGAAADRVPSVGTVNSKYPWSARCSHCLVACVVIRYSATWDYTCHRFATYVSACSVRT